MFRLHLRKEFSVINRELKEQLKSLSMELFGSSSRWVKLLENGSLQLVTEEVTEYVPSEKDGEDGTTRQVKVPMLHEGMKVSRIERLSPEKLTEELLKLKTQSYKKLHDGNE